MDEGQPLSTYRKHGPSSYVCPGCLRSYLSLALVLMYRWAPERYSAPPVLLCSSWLLMACMDATLVPPHQIADWSLSLAVDTAQDKAEEILAL